MAHTSEQLERAEIRPTLRLAPALVLEGDHPQNISIGHIEKVIVYPKTEVLEVRTPDFSFQTRVSMISTGFSFLP